MQNRTVLYVLFACDSLSYAAPGQLRIQLRPRRMLGSNLDRPGECRTGGNCPQRLRREVPKEQSISMKPHFKSGAFLSLLLTSFVLSACGGPVGSGSGGTGGGGGGGGTGPFTVGGTVSGLAAGGSMTLQDNGADSLVVSANGAFTFKTAIVANKPYLVTVSVPPATPPQTCTVAGGSGTTTANVTTVVVTCTTGTEAIGVTVGGLTGTGLVLQNGTEFLTITGTTTTSQFKTAIPFGQTYNVTVSTQPTSPAQTCTVTNGSGTSTAGVAINVQVTCSLGTLPLEARFPDIPEVQVLLCKTMVATL